MKAERDKLLELAERCEKASGPDRELDCEIGRACGVAGEAFGGPLSKGQSPLPMSKAVNGGRHYSGVFFPAYTASLDAALMLVPEGLLWNAGHAHEGFGATVTNFLVDCDYPDVRAATPALALTAASLRAIAAQGGE